MDKQRDWQRGLHRRDLLKGAAAGMTSVLMPFPGYSNALAPANGDLIRAENEKAGTTDWMLTNTRVDPKTKYRCPWIEGYCSHNSLRAGDTLSIYVSTNPASPFKIDIYRLGYYGGKGGRHLLELDGLKGRVQPDPAIGIERLRECQWEPTVKLTIPKDWPSGVYLGKLTAEKDKMQSYIVFIVRDDRVCDFLFQCSDTTWSAYNRWPDEWSLYNSDKKKWYWGPKVRVSFDRPYGKYCQILDAPLSQGSGEFLLWEFPFCYWMEKEGYDVSYISNIDSHADAKGLLRGKAFLSIGHDEYWSLDMYNNVLAAIKAGVNAGFFCGNSVCGVIKFFDNANKVPHRAFSRIARFSRSRQEGFPSDNEDVAMLPSGPDEGLLMGAGSPVPANGGGDWICVKPEHWIFAGTGMKKGDRIKGLVGWEFHGLPAKIPGLEIVAEGKTKKKSCDGAYAATIYPGPKGNFVFNAATCWWSDGLSEPPGYKRPTAHNNTPPGPDARVQKITTNLFERFRGKG